MQTHCVIKFKISGLSHLQLIKKLEVFSHGLQGPNPLLGSFTELLSAVELLDKPVLFLDKEFKVEDFADGVPLLIAFKQPVKLIPENVNLKACAGKYPIASFTGNVETAPYLYTKVFEDELNESAQRYLKELLQVEFAKQNLKLW